VSFPAPRLARPLARALCLTLFAVLPVVMGCGSGAGTPPPTETPAPDWTLPGDSYPTDGPEATATPAELPPAELAEYLTRLPTFGPAPTPVPVALPHVDGQAAFVHEIPTSQPVAFLTIDDGMVRHPQALAMLKAAKIPVTLFLTTNYVNGNQDFFKALRDTGYATIEGHTISHPQLTKLGYGDQRHQLCGATDQLQGWYGGRPTLFRPPYGERNDDTLRAAWSCGLKAGFHWRETVDSGNVYYQRGDKKVHAGDIMLMHFRPMFLDDFVAALIAIKAAGLTPALLEDYVDLAPGTAPVYVPQPQPPAPQPPAPQPPAPQPPAPTTTTTEPSTPPPTTDPPATTPPPTTPPPTPSPTTSQPVARPAARGSIMAGGS
jgi:peptidoglycan/xylan/chitin deacetylase (PgdA/CDA1 family)